MTAISKKTNTPDKRRCYLVLSLLVILGVIAFRLLSFSRDNTRYCDVLGFSQADSVTLWSFESIIALIMSAAVLYTVYRLLFKKNDMVRLFTALVFVFGFFFLLTISPLSVADEVTHFEAIYELSCKLLGRSVDPAFVSFEGFSNHLNVCTGYLRVLRDFGGSYAFSGSVERNIVSSMWTLTYFAEYIPQIIGFSIALLLGRNMVTAFMLARFFNLLFYVLCVYLALKRNSKFRTLFGLAALMPMALQQAASLSYDNFINALSFLLLASLLEAVFSGEKFSIKKLLFIFLPAALLAPAKGVYCLVIALYLFIPKESFSELKIGKKGSFALLLGACALMFAIVSVPSIIRIMTSVRPGFETTGDSQYSVSYIFSHPLDTIQIFADTFNVYILQWLGGAVGYTLSTYTLDLPAWIVPVYFALLILSAQNVSGKDTELCRGMRPTLLAYCAFVVFAFMMTMFLTWISDTDKIIVGVQGRYFIPIIPPLMICLKSKFVELKKDPTRAIVIVCVLLLARTVLEIFSYTLFSSV
jgi:uncharacterized membrane protein